MKRDKYNRMVGRWKYSNIPASYKEYRSHVASSTLKELRFRKIFSSEVLSLYWTNSYVDSCEFFTRQQKQRLKRALRAN